MVLSGLVSLFERGKGGGKGRDRLFKARRAAVICVSSFVIDKPRHLTQLYTHS